MNQIQPINLPITYDDLKKITIPHAAPVDVVDIEEKDGFFLSTKFTHDFRIRKTVYEKLKEAQKKLPAGCHFMVYEAYRPLKKQMVMWNDTMALLRKKYPAANEAEIVALTETFIANPYDGIGSGHQACCAIDITLCDSQGVEVSMGTACQQFDPRSITPCPDIPEQAKKNRGILVGALESVGLINYPAEWWHFSYGDHQWAFLMGNNEALFGPIDI